MYGEAICLPVQDLAEIKVYESFLLVLLANIRKISVSQKA